MCLHAENCALFHYFLSTHISEFKLTFSQVCFFKYLVDHSKHEHSVTILSVLLFLYNTIKTQAFQQTNFIPWKNSFTLILNLFKFDQTELQYHQRIPFYLRNSTGPIQKISDRDIFWSTSQSAKRLDVKGS